MAEDYTNAQWQPVYDKLHQNPSALQRAPGQQKALANQPQTKAKAEAEAKSKANPKTPGAPVASAAPGAKDSQQLDSIKAKLAALQTENNRNEQLAES
eukprot:2047687-Karenia_brevis.AAC.1